MQKFVTELIEIISRTLYNIQVVSIVCLKSKRINNKDMEIVIFVMERKNKRDKFKEDKFYYRMTWQIGEFFKFQSSLSLWHLSLTQLYLVQWINICIFILTVSKVYVFREWRVNCISETIYWIDNLISYFSKIRISVENNRWPDLFSFFVD